MKTQASDSSARHATCHGLRAAFQFSTLAAFVGLAGMASLAHAAGGAHTGHRPAQPAPATAAVVPAPGAAASGKRADPSPAALAGFSYQRFTFDEPLANWRATNDTVRAIGGWRAYLKEVQDAQAQAQAQDKARTTPTPPASGPTAAKEKP